MATFASTDSSAFKALRIWSSCSLRTARFNSIASRLASRMGFPSCSYKPRLTWEAFSCSVRVKASIRASGMNFLYPGLVVFGVGLDTGLFDLDTRLLALCSSSSSKI